MAEKDNFSEEVEEQLQNLVSDFSNQIEKRLTQIISTASTQESSEKNKGFSKQIHQLEKKTTTLTEQLDDERSKKANSEARLIAHEADSAIKLAELQQENTFIKQQLVSEIEKQEQTQANRPSKIQITPDEKELRELQQKITALNERLAISVAQDNQ